jgi:hypothetical protein
VFPVNVQLINSFGVVVQTGLFQQKQRNRLNPDFYICQHSLSLAAVPEGAYKVRLTAGNNNLISEPIIVRNRFEFSVLLEYRHHRFHGDVVFETGFSPEIRVLGSLNFKTPASKDTIYEDQSLNTTLIHNVPYRIHELILSDSFGIPDYFIDKLNRILGCSELFINGRQYTKAEGARLEESRIEDYPMRGWKIDMRDRLNRHSNHIEDNSPVIGSIVIAANSDSKGFGDTGGLNTVVIDVE